MGVTPGVADLALVLPGGGAAFIELKAPGREGATSPAQRAFAERCRKLGARWAEENSLEGVIARLEGWGVDTRAKAR